MPVTGRDKKATPLAVWEASREYWGDFIDVFPKPRKGESFNAYFERIDWKEEAIFKAVVGVGCTSDDSSVNRRNYLMALEDMSKYLWKLKAILDKKWEK